MMPENRLFREENLNTLRHFGSRRQANYETARRVLAGCRTNGNPLELWLRTRYAVAAATHLSQNFNVARDPGVWNLAE